MKKIAAKTLGCKTNQYETEAILSQLPTSKFSVIDFSQKADVYLINTCCVTNKAEAKSRYEIRKIIKNRPGAKIIVAGCYVELGSRFLKKNQDRILLYLNNKKPIIINEIIEKKRCENSSSSLTFPEIGLEKPIYHSRVPVKVQTGCNFNCAYCIIPFVRGKPLSRKSEHVIEQVNKLVAHKVTEIVLTGINLGLYGMDLNDHSLIKLIDDITHKTKIKQIRISSLEPMFLTQELISYFSNNPKIAPHYHISLQSGSNKILNAMGRNYTTNDIRDILNRIKTKIPDAAIGSDVIVGFPGESTREFKVTYNFIKDNLIDYLHVFRYSRRPGTKASSMKNQIHSRDKKKRMEELTKLGLQKKKEYSNYIVNKKVPLKAVAERRNNDLWQSVSDHYVRTTFKADNINQGELVELIPVENLNQSNIIISKLKHDSNK